MRMPHPSLPRIRTPKRKYRRFNLSYPVHVRIASGGSPTEVESVSKNICMGGLLLEAPVLIPLHAAVDFIIDLRGRRSQRLIPVHGEGEVVRVERGRPGCEFGIAVACRNPITQLESHLPSL